MSLLLKKRSRNKPHGQMCTFLVKYVCADAEGIHELLKTKHWTLSIPNWIFRAVGQPVFVNNPISGLLILIALFLGDPWVALCGTICLISAIVTAFAVKQEYGQIESGVCTFHGLLIGLLLGVSVDREWYPLLILPLIILGSASGLIILIALFLGNPWVALCGTICLISAIVTAFAVKQEYGQIESGVCTFHGLLIGLLLGVSVDREWYPLLILPLIILGSASVYVANGVGNIYSVWNLPALTLPFCLVTFVFLGGLDSGSSHFPMKVAPDSVSNETAPDWGKVFLSIPISVGQVYAYGGLLTGCLIFVAICLASPILALHALIGAFISAFTAIGMSAPYTQVYSGLWGYSAVLTSEAVGGFFFRLTPHSHILAWLGAVLTTLVHATMSRCFMQLGLPVLTMPFVLTTSVLLAFTSKSPQFWRIPMGKISSPERHLSLDRDAEAGGDAEGEALEEKSLGKVETELKQSLMDLNEI
ncbi:unnamed protein product [Owenia fusiformis]|uniref:Urea transporter n=1 Tax=Owenia fusiformis TaxID=6347 RepID=A0A8S4PIT1_OWEFU|nr:unnamed protein product [Owenia fusiformis]